MARIETDPNYTTPTFSRATAATDPFKKEDVQNLAAAFSTHVHDGTGKGLAIAATGIPAGSITGAMIVDGTITSADIADGTITAADIADATITNAKLGVDVARDNLLVNGGMEVWQRGNGPFSANGAFTADRWQLSLSGGDTASVQRISTGQAASVYGAVLTTTHSTGAVDLMQTLKTADESLIGKTLTFSALVWANTPGASLILARDGTGGGSAQSAAHPGNSTWQTLSITAPIPGDATYVQCHFWIAGSGTVNIDNAMLVVGSQPANYVPMHPADDLARCLRYYETIGGTNGEYLVTGQAYNTTNTLSAVRWTTRKPVTPTVTFPTGPGGFSCYSAAASPITLTAISAGGITLAGTQISATVASGLVAGNAALLHSNTSLGTIVIESNP